jgi:hypothetical protein
MRRRYVSDAELTEVIKLKQAGASWLKIQKKTGIPRRSAKRAYEDWERTKSSEELKRARSDVAAEEFRRHLNDLASLARSLVDSLYTPQPMDEIGNADDLLERLWKTDIRKETTPYPGEKEERRMVRQNKMLFKSLEDHTREKVRWQALEEWKQVLTGYIQHCKVLRSKALETIVNILNRQPELQRRIQAGSRDTDMLADMAKGVVEALWRAILTGGPDQDNVFIRTRSLGERGTEVSFGREASRIALTFGDGKLAEEVATVCQRAATHLCQGKDSLLLQSIGEDIAGMQERARELEEMLDSLVLRPIILRTRCELCPA